MNGRPRPKPFGALDEILVVEADDRHRGFQQRPPPAPLPLFAGERIPAAEEHQPFPPLHRVERQPHPVGEGQHFLAELRTVEEVRRQLEELPFDVAEDDDVVLVEDLFIVTGAELVEIPRGDALDGVGAGRFEGTFEPRAVVEDLDPLHRILEGALGEPWPGEDCPVADVVDLGHGGLLSVCDSTEAIRREGATVPCRRTFAQAIHGLHSLGCRLRFAILASLACNAVSHGTVAPSLPGALGGKRCQPPFVSRPRPSVWAVSLRRPANGGWHLFSGLTKSGSVPAPASRACLPLSPRRLHKKRRDSRPGRWRGSATGCGGR